MLLRECGCPSCSVNPARGFGPAMVSRTFHQYWIFWVGPLTGAAVAAVIYQTVFTGRVSNLQSAYSRSASWSVDDSFDCQLISSTATSQRLLFQSWLQWQSGLTQVLSSTQSIKTSVSSSVSQSVFLFTSWKGSQSNIRQHFIADLWCKCHQTHLSVKESLPCDNSK